MVLDVRRAARSVRTVLGEFAVGKTAVRLIRDAYGGTIVPFHLAARAGTLTT